jgi:ribonucleotide monophosphatase NagD (HAD superfamily)
MGFSPEVVVGKPSPIAFRIALEVASAEPEHILMIGDRLETDILGAQAVGLATALILSGVSQADDVHKLGIKPTWMASDLAALARGEISPP